jgi:hypothetical protein
VEVSLACRSFIDCANRRDWRNAVFNLNGLNMYEMLRSLKALDAGDITSLRAGASRERATDRVRALCGREQECSGDGAQRVTATGQVAEARTFQARPRSILVELIPRVRITGYNVGLTNASNATMQARFGAPRATYSQNCQAVTDPALAGRWSPAASAPSRSLASTRRSPA